MTCPPFARGTAAALRANATAIDAALLVVDNVAWALTSSVVLAPIGLQLEAVSLTVTLLQGDCEGDAALQVLARRAKTGCDAMVVVCDVALVVSTVLVNPPALAFFGVARGLFASLSSVLGPLAAGRAPSSSATTTLIKTAGDAGGYDTDEIVGFIQGASSALQDNGAVRAAVGAVMDEEEQEQAEASLAPMFQWTGVTTDPPGGSSRTGLFNAYSHAYQAAAEEAYALDPDANLRPWLATQAGIDVEFLMRKRGELAALAGTNPARFARLNASINFAIEGLGAWLVAAEEGTPGAWSRATLRRVLRSSQIQNNLPVVVDDGSNGGSSESSGGGNGAAAAAVILGLLFAAATR